MLHRAEVDEAASDAPRVEGAADLFEGGEQAQQVAPLDDELTFVTRIDLHWQQRLRSSRSFRARTLHMQYNILDAAGRDP